MRRVGLLINRYAYCFSLKNRPFPKEKEVKDPQLAAKFYKEGLAFHEQKELEKAIFCYSKSIQKDEKNFKPYLNMGLAYSTLQKHSKAVENLKKYLDCKPKETLALKCMGHSLQQINQIELAISYYHLALQQSPNDPLLYYNLATIYEQQGETKKKSEDIQKAILLYKKAIQLDSSLKEAYNNLGSIFMTQGKTKKAEEMFKEAIKNDKNFSSAYFNLSLVYSSQDNYLESVYNLEKAKELDPENGQIYYNLSHSYAKLGDTEKAKQYFQMSQKYLFSDDDSPSTS